MKTQTETAKRTQLSVKVQAINVLNTYAEQFFKYEKEYFKQFLGKSIFKKDGSIMAKYEHERQSIKGKLEDGTYFDAHYWFENSYSSFDIHVKICINGGSYEDKPSTAFCQYESMRLQLYKTDTNGILIEAQERQTDFKNDYSESEIQAIANEIKEAATVYRNAAAKIPYMFTQVCNIERLTR